MVDGKNILVYGLGISGLSAIKALSRYNCKIILLDSKSEKDLFEDLKKIKDIKIKKILNGESVDLSGIDMIIKSPGIPPDNDILVEAGNMGIDILTDLELASRLSNFDSTIIVTGTNGKTTTVTLINEILLKKYKNVNLLGNIGRGVLEILESDRKSVNVIEASSFQLEHTKQLRSKIAVIINLSPDHLDWHGSYQNYIDSKMKILENQTEDDFAILNFDDEEIRKSIKSRRIRSKIVWFSVNQSLDQGIWVENGWIIIKDRDLTIKVFDVSETDLILENLLAAIGAGYYFGVGINEIADVIHDFSSLPHRMEYVETIEGISFYNDSKGTNPEATIKAIESIEGDKILIAGGYDKGAKYDSLAKSLGSDIKRLILFGETKEKIKRSALEYGFNNIKLVDSMEEAVRMSYRYADNNSTVLLSPACASWGMYENFEERGNDFKEEVRRLRVENYAKEKNKRRTK